MMRKEAKLGFVVGGILIAVLVVYVLVVPGKKKTNQEAVLLDESGKTEQQQAQQSSNPQEPAPLAATGTLDASRAEKPPGQTPGAAPSPAQSTDPFATNTTERPKSTEEDKWMMALNDGAVPMMTTSAPPPPLAGTGTKQNGETSLTAAAAAAAAVKSQATETPTAGPVTPAPTSEAEVRADPGPMPVTPSTQPINGATAEGSASSGKMNTHVVQKGESIAKIAQAAYGSQAYWPHIIRANPGIVAERLRPGMTLNLPSIEDVKGPAGSGGAAQTASAVQAGTPLDPNTQYEVQTGDSLAKIAMKLYGSSTRWQAIYDANKETIGDNPARLRVHSVIKLPEPPTVKQPQ